MKQNLSVSSLSTSGLSSYLANSYYSYMKTIISVTNDGNVAASLHENIGNRQSTFRFNKYLLMLLLGVGGMFVTNDTFGQVTYTAVGSFPAINSNATANNVTVTNSNVATAGTSKIFSCLNGGSSIAAASLGSSTSTYLEFTTASGYKIDSASIIWMANTSNQSIAYIWSSSAITVASSIASITNGGINNTSTLAASGNTNCPGQMIKFPSGDTVTSFLMQRLMSYTPATTLNTNYSTLNVRLASSSSPYTSSLGNGSSAYVGQLVLYVTAIPTSSCTSAGISVNPTPTSACVGGTATTISITGTGSSPTYYWQYSPDNGTTPWASVLNGTTANITYAGSSTNTLSITAAAGATTGYYRCVDSVSCNLSADTSTSALLSINAQPVAPTLSVASPVDGSVICAGFNTGTVTGAAGSGGGTGSVDTFRVSINGGSTWNNYVNGAAITTTGATGSVIVQSMRTAGTGCTSSSWGTISTWTVNAQPTAPTLSVSSPANSSVICVGYNSGTVTGTAGYGGGTGAIDTFVYSIDGGSTWNNYTNSSVITTTGATGSVEVQAMRTAGIGSGCNATSWGTISTWTLGTAPTTPVLSLASPADGSTICAGFNTGTVLGAAGSGGSTGAIDTFRYSIDGGTTWSTYTNGAAITTNGATGNIVIQTERTGGNYGCTTSNGGTLATWTVGSTPTAPALSLATPVDGSTICAGDNSGTVLGSAGSGGSTGAIDTFRYSIDGGTTWNGYTNGAAIITTGATVSVIVQSQRSGGSYGCTASSWNTISTWTVNCALPVIINTISATSSKSDAIVAWSTATELNVSRFVIERSIDGSSFSDIGTVNAVGIGANNYQFTDNAPVNGVNYYRLKSIDNNGSFTYSKVVSVSLLTNNQLSVFPNPTTDKITVNGNHIASVQVVDNMGRITIAQTYKDVTNPVLSVSGLPVGVYHLRVQTTDGKISGIGFVKH